MKEIKNGYWFVMKKVFVIVDELVIFILVYYILD